MEENLLNDWEKRFKRYLFYSLTAHLSLFVFFTVRAILFNAPEIDVSSAMLVELVALPDKAPQEAPATAAPAPTSAPQPPVAKVEEVKTKPELKPKPILDDAINLEKSRNKQKDALKKLQQQEALEKLQKEMEQEARSQAVQTAKKQYKGNVISPGNSLTGTQKFVQQNYTNEIDRIFRSNWALPQYLRGQNLATEINVKFDEQGNIISSEIEKPSGNPVFDDMALAAVKKSSPVPAPPEQFVQVAKMIGFLFRFRE